MNTADSTSLMHHEFAHDSIADLGYDWSRIGDPGIAAKPPFKVYLPRDAADVARAVAESRALGETLTVRGSGHSSNDLVLDYSIETLHRTRMDARVTTGVWVADAEHRALVAADGSGRADGSRHQRSFGSRRRSPRTALVRPELRRVAEIHRKDGIIPPPQHSTRE